MQFIRDLQGDFESYVPTTVGTLIPLTKNPSVEVIEATFTTFAYLFKYLHRPLTSKPNPVFDAFAVLLGRDAPQKQYIVRFAAESLSFLLRRTRSSIQTSFLEHVMKSVEDTNRDSYTEGVSYLFAETIKGVEHSIHAKGLVLFEAFQKLVVRPHGHAEAEDAVSLAVMENVTINLLHHCTRESFRPILESYISMLSSKIDRTIQLGWRMCFISCAVRKGTRIEDWSQLLKALLSSLSTDGITDSWNAVRLTSVLFTYAPHEAILPLATKIIALLQDHNSINILCLAEILCKQHLINFSSFVLPQYRKYICDRWSMENDAMIMRSVINLAKLDAFVQDSSNTLERCLRVSDSIISDTVANLDTADVSRSGQAEARVLVQFSGVIGSAQLFRPALQRLLSRCIDNRENRQQTRDSALLIGTILELLARLKDSLDPQQVDRFIKHTGLWASSAFLRGFAKYSVRCAHVKLNDQITRLLLDNLSFPGHYRRLHSIQILQRADADYQELDLDLLSVSEIIESTDLTLDATRSLAMQIRKLNQHFHLLKNATTITAIAKFSMGLMTGNYTPFWSFCSETLGVVSKTEPDLVWSLAMDWFRNHEFDLGTPEEALSAPDISSEVHEAQMDCFKCFNTRDLRQNCEDSRRVLQHSRDVAISVYAADSAYQDEEKSVSRRSQAIRIFSAMPELAEQHSRELVPVFLAQFSTLEDDDEDEVILEETRDETVGEDLSEDSNSQSVVPESQIVSSPKFNKKERNDLLTLFSKFLNPAAFSDTGKIRDVVMELLSSRDSRTQTLAFEVILHYRDPTLKKYEDNLKNLLSDNRSRDEITTFLQTDAEESMIEDRHRRHVMPVVARILYGKMINRRHASSQKKGLTNNRNIILGAVASMDGIDIAEFVTLFLRSFKQLAVVDKSESIYQVNDVASIVGPSLRKQIGFCTMMQDALEQLAGKVLPFVGDILDALIYCFLSASYLLDTTMDTEENKVQLKIARNVRHSVYNTMELLFRYCRTYEWRPYLDLIFQHFVNPRLDKLPIESSQNPSGLLKLLSNWSSSPITSPFLVQYNDAVLPKVFDCLAEKSLKDQVAIFVLNIVQSLCDQVKDDSIVFEGSVRTQLLQDKAELFLDRMTDLLEHQKFSSTNNTINSDFLELEISVLSSISTLVSGGSAIQKLLDLLMPLLQKPRKVVSEVIKEGILTIVENFLLFSQDYLIESPSLWKRYNALGSLFGTASSRKSRTSLTSIMQIFTKKDANLDLCASLIADLNSFSTRRLDTPDFDRRLAAFSLLNEKHYLELSIKAWRPLLYNMIFFIGDEEELAIRTNATYSVRRLIDVTRDADGDEQAQYLRILETDLYPGIKKGMRHPSELIRQEWIGLLGYAVQECSFWSQVSDMVPLLVGGDEEASFFYNILHIQQHRRMRALRRLATISQINEIQSSNIAQVILPMIEHYCFMPKDETHNLIAETIRTIGQLSQAMKFNQYCALLKRYITMLKPSESTQTTVVRLIAAVVDALVGTPEVATELVDYMQDEEDSTEAELEQESNMSDVVPRKEIDSVERLVPVLRSSQPSSEKVHETITSSFLPHLTKYLHSKDDETVALRVPVALTVVKLLAALPHEALTMKLPGVLTDLCHILRSRSQDARDMTRKTLGLIATLLGPKYFSYILAELKSALQRGYQLHVLGFSVHTVLVKLQPEYGSLDYCLNQLVDMLIDDIFGETGIEKETEEYVTKMKEMKTTKSYDSFEILASSTKLSSLGEILWPLKTLLAETSSLKVVRKVDEVCRRLTLGILRNEGCDTRESLLFCYNVYQQTMSSTQDKVVRLLSIQEQARKDAERNYVVDLKARKSFIRDHFKANAHKLLKFALETLRAILQKHSTLQTGENLAAFVPVIGDSMMSGYEDVHIAALRLTTQIVKVDLRALDSGAPVFLEQAVGFIKKAPSTNTEICQAALKFISAILKERKTVSVKDSILAYLLIRIKADIEEPDRQGVTFSILRSIMSRKFMVPELYDVMDEVGNMMVTNQSAGPRDTARSAFYQFLVDYPQGKGRLKKQLAFLVKNLEYVHASGRKSVMEALHLIVTHFDDSILQEYIMMLYFACTMALINDDEASCREMAAALLQKLLQRADKERLTSIIAALRSWAYNDQMLLQRASVQGLGLVFEVKEGRKEDVKFFMEKFVAVLRSAAKAATIQDDEGDAVMDTDEGDWQIVYYSLQTFSKILSKGASAFISSKYATLWSDIQELLLFKHAWVRLSAARLIGTLFANRQVTSSSGFTAGRDLVWRDVDLVRTARHSLIQLRSPLLSEDLGTQITKNLIFLLRFFQDKVTMLPPKDDVEEQEEDESSRELKTCVAWLVQRVATFLQSDRDVKKETHMLVRRLLLQFFAASIQILPVEILEAQGTVVARPLYKYAEMQTHNSDQTAIKDLAIEVFEMLKNKIGQTKYAEIYNTVRQAQIATRQERKQKRTIENVKFPERGAMKKVKASLKKRTKRAEVSHTNKRRREMRN